MAKTFIVVKPGMSPTDGELDAYCRQHLATYKVPRAYAIVDELPKSPSGKVLKRVLRDSAPGPCRPSAPSTSAAS